MCSSGAGKPGNASHYSLIWSPSVPTPNLPAGLPAGSARTSAGDTPASSEIGNPDNDFFRILFSTHTTARGGMNSDLCCHRSVE